MYRAVSARVAWVMVALSGSCCGGCSILGERPPPSDPAQRTTRVAAHCANYQYPLADTVSTVAAVTWVLFANRKIEENEPKPEGYVSNQFGGVDYMPGSSGSPSDVSSYKLLRAGGYGAVGLFAASAIYGLVIEAQCHSLQQEIRARTEKPSDTPLKRTAFPSSVFGFGFELPRAPAERHCAELGRTWSFEANAGLCQATVSSVATPDVRLEFELGVPSQIVVVYTPPNPQFATNYQQLFAAMRKIHGPPQVEPRPLSATCSASLVSCLQEGERPAGPVWRWSRGSLELSPVWKGDHAALELHYSRGEPDAY